MPLITRIGSHVLMTRLTDDELTEESSHADKRSVR